MIQLLLTITLQLAALLLLGLGVIFVIRWYLRSTVERRAMYKDCVFLIRVPKESLKVEEGKDRGSQSHVESLREKIALMNTLLANISGLHKQGSFSRFFWGPQQYISFEIVVKGGLIYFYIVCPHQYKNFVEEQVHGQFGEAEITEESDYNIFSEYGAIKAGHLILRRTSVLPIKTYKECEADPLNAITTALSKFTANEGAAIQIIAQPRSVSWGRRSLKIASAMQQGKNLSDALHGGGGILKMFQHGAYSVLTSPKYASTKKKDALTQDKKFSSKEPYKLSPLEEEVVKNIENKASQFAFGVNINIIVSTQSNERSQAILVNTANAYAQFDLGERGNGFHLHQPRMNERMISDFIFRRFRYKSSFILNTEEIASVWHLPTHGIETPNIVWLFAKRAAPPSNIGAEGIIVGKSTYRGVDKIIRIKEEDRRRHLYIIGKSGSGKSTLIANLAIQDVQNGEGVCVLDPHGDLVETVLEHIPKERVDDIIYFDPSDMERPMGLNMLEFKTEEQKDFAVQEMIAIFYKLFPPEMIGPMFEHNMRNVMLTLMADREYPGTIADIPRMFTDKSYQQYKIAKLADPVVRAFWEKEMAQTTDFHKSEMLGYLISKVGRFVENEMIRNIIGQPKSGFDFREVMDKKKILLINLSKGKTGEVNSSLLGLIIVSKLQMASMTRAELPEKDRNDFYLYIDEFQNFITDSIATILSEARKYRLDLILAHQYLGQLKDEKGQQKVLDAVLGNVGSMVVFRVGVEDAEIIAKELAPVFNEYDVVNIEKYRAYVKLLIDNTAAPAFDMEMLPPSAGNLELARSIKELSRLKFTRPRAVVEAEILERTKLGAPTSHADFTTVESSL